jgi:hypothetical protein
MYGDWVHANIVEHNDERDEIVFCSHLLNELYVIDHSTTTEQAAGHTGGRRGKGGDILYRWGNPQNYRRGDSADQHFFVVHGANWIKPGLVGAGNILVFNNGDRPGTADDYSSVEEIAPPLDSNGNYYIHPDSAFGPDELAWVYQNTGFYSGNMSGAYRMPNGNTFITEAVSGRLSEVTYDKQVVWQRMTAAWNGRAIKYPRDFAAVSSGPSFIVPRSSFTVSPTPVRAGQPTRIRYELHSACRVRLQVFDAAGRPVAELTHGEQGPGPHAVEFSFPRSAAPSGVYFVRLAVQSGSGAGSGESIKLVISK